jgi:putative flippase GtrA
MALPDAGLYSRIRRLLPELIKFGVVGGIGSVIDLGGAAVLHGKYHVGPLESKAISTAVATVVTYLGSRFWTFKDRENQSLRREAVLFIMLNLAGLFIAEAVIAFVTYALGRHSQLEYNAASVVGTGLATIFRYFAYRRWVFTAPAESLLVSATAAETGRFPDYPPWELDPAYLLAEVEATAHDPAPAPASSHTYSDPWEPAAGQDPWEPAAERRQPWMEKQVTLPGERLVEPLLAAQSSAAQSSGGPSSGAQDSGPVDPVASERLQGRHRRQ